MTDTTMTSKLEGLVKIHGAVEEICIDVTKGLDPARGMYKVMSVMGKQAETQTLSGEQLLIAIGRRVREIVVMIRTTERAEQLGMSSLFEESVKWMATLMSHEGDVAVKEKEKETSLAAERRVAKQKADGGKKKKKKNKGKRRR